MGLITIGVIILLAALLLWLVGAGMVVADNPFGVLVALLGSIGFTVGGVVTAIGIVLYVIDYIKA